MKALIFFTLSLSKINLNTLYKDVIKLVEILALPEAIYHFLENEVANKWNINGKDKDSNQI